LRAGQRAEERAAAFLGERGFLIIERNYRCRFGEIDIVAEDGDCLVFVEVRSRSSSGHGDALDAVGLKKQRQVAKVAQAYLDLRRPKHREIRFDVIGITGERLEHVPDAFRVDG
jgi:putative endonuclease